MWSHVQVIDVAWGPQPCEFDSSTCLFGFRCFKNGSTENLIGIKDSMIFHEQVTFLGSKKSLDLSLCHQDQDVYLLLMIKHEEIEVLMECGKWKHINYLSILFSRHFFYLHVNAKLIKCGTDQYSCVCEFIHFLCV